MRIPVAALLGGALACAAPLAWGQTPGIGSAAPSPGAAPAPPPGAPAASQPVPGSTSGANPAAAPLPPFLQPAPQPFSPPPSLPAPGPGPASVPLSSTPLQVPAESPPLRLAGHVGFGMGIWGLPAYSPNNNGTLGGVAVGGALDVRWWVTERLALLPTLSLSFAHTSTPDKKSAFGDVVPGSDSTTATVAPAILFSYAVYSGKSTRFLLSAGPGFVYTVQPDPTQQYPDGSPKPQPDDLKRSSFAVLAGFAFEQFFTPRLSLVLGADSPVFAFTSSQSGDNDPTTQVSADFSSTRLTAAVFFYTE